MEEMFMSKDQGAIPLAPTLVIAKRDGTARFLEQVYDQPIVLINAQGGYWRINRIYAK
jgi:hypothetical protein